MTKNLVRKAAERVITEAVTSKPPAGKKFLIMYGDRGDPGLFVIPRRMGNDEAGTLINQAVNGELNDAELAKSGIIAVAQDDYDSYNDDEEKD